MVKLYLGDCLEILKTIETGSVDFILTDPPYGTTACKWDSIIPFEPMWAELKRIRKPNAATVLFGSEPFSSYLRTSNIKEFKYDWIWDKVTGVGQLVAKIRPLAQHETISVFGSGKIFYSPQMTERENPKKSQTFSTSELIKSNGTDQVRTLSHRYPKTILRHSKASRAKKDLLHPTQKPIPLLEYLIKTYTNEGGTVLDFTMGSSSTGVACRNLNRKFIGIEKEEKYFEIARQRILTTGLNQN